MKTLSTGSQYFTWFAISSVMLKLPEKIIYKFSSETYFSWNIKSILVYEHICITKILELTMLFEIVLLWFVIHSACGNGNVASGKTLWSYSFVISVKYCWSQPSYIIISKDLGNKQPAIFCVSHGTVIAEFDLPEFYVRYITYIIKMYCRYLCSRSIVFSVLLFIFQILK